ncbi:glycosyltransferase family 2 protein [Roseomonas haemaphysalidis]|uniref:Glycosyltransferase family 2 protein n=1 Tax=Roseomonas haemaphysalidis TaxID=2768162 RepID=A0ABS3KSW1_9PROT|nr:glycosyltransferase family A protein [Roseomonas haemaphysalidis]MBO1080560.1 glycosyltransferase family 2 protein [Roseomonas haemaphysalidis]
MHPDDLLRSRPLGNTVPRLSILVPTYDRDVVPLCQELLADIATLDDPLSVELLVLIDGNPTLEGQGAVIEAASTTRPGMVLDATLAPFSHNLGRGEARNTLARLARGETLLFLDADGMPDRPGFVGRALAEAGNPGEIVCGGRTGRRCPPAPADAKLFEHHSRKREWIPAAARNQDPAGTFMSANFMASRDMFLAHPFDDAFKGWGWEDAEWALRIARVASIRHVDNSVSHMEHHRDADWLGRLERSATNYRRLFALHPDAVRRHRLFKLIRRFRRVETKPGLAPTLRRVALAQGRIPVQARLMALKLYQALIYTRALPFSLDG